MARRLSTSLLRQPVVETGLQSGRRLVGGQVVPGNALATLFVHRLQQASRRRQAGVLLVQAVRGSAHVGVLKRHAHRWRFTGFSKALTIASLILTPSGGSPAIVGEVSGGIRGCATAHRADAVGKFYTAPDSESLLEDYTHGLMSVMSIARILLARTK
jgi:hypothetical protein